MRRRGFTLVELILALGLFAILALFITGILRSVVGLWQAGERRGRGDLVFAGMVEQLQADLRALHTGSEGWLVLDEWEAVPATAEHPAWRLPRLRFLARGSVLGDPAAAAGPVEVAWLLAPEAPERSRLARLLRLAVPLDPLAGSIREEARLRALLPAAVVVLDGVAGLELELQESDGRWQGPPLTIPPDTPLGFPARLRLRLERVGGNTRRRPPVLDADLSPTGTEVLLRGSPPLEIAGVALVDRERVGVAGTWPRLRLTARGLDGTMAAEHHRGVPFLLPEVREARLRLAWGGRRLP